jgi:hypothetical protein
MLSDVDAVIAALRVVLHEAETRNNFSRTDAYWKTHIVNKWIYQLPGARWGRWRELRLRPDCGDLAERQNLIMHVRATLAYLETNRETIAARRSWWPFGRRATSPAPEAPAAMAKEKPSPPQEPQEAPLVPDRSTKPKWLN